MTDHEKPKPRNSSYIFEEGNSGGGPDCGSSNSSSSAGSGMKFIAQKLKPQGRVRVMVLVLIVIIVVVLVAAIATAVYFTSGSKEESPKTLRQIDTDDQEGSTTSTSLPSTTSITPDGSGLTSSVTSYPVTSQTTVVQTTSTLPESTTPFVDNTQPSDPAVEITDILYHPEDVRSLTVKCHGRHQGNWNTLTLRRQFHDSYEPIAVVTKNDEGSEAVIVFYPNVTHKLVVRNYEITLILTLDPFYCEQLTNFTCAMDTDAGVVSTAAKISVFMPGVEIQLPHSVVEDLLISLQCMVDVFETNATILWKFKPNGADDFMDFSVAPVTEVTQKDTCTYSINSTLTFTATLYENGSDFRCEVIAPWWSPSIIQEKTSGAVLHVLPKSFCDDKRQFSIHAHPNGPCTRVIYCLNTGPLVYEIDCEPGYCYDTSKTTCVLQDAT